MLDKKATIELVGTVGVIASLIFVGVQIQQGAAATRSATVLQLKDSWVQLNLAGATSLDLAQAFTTGQTEGLGSDPNAEIRAEHDKNYHWILAYGLSKTE